MFDILPFACDECGTTIMWADCGSPGLIAHDCMADRWIPILGLEDSDSQE